MSFLTFVLHQGTDTLLELQPFLLETFNLRESTSETAVKTTPKRF